MAIAKTDENRAKLNALYRMLKIQTLTKQKIMDLFKVSERTARDMLSEIAKRAPLISVSDTAGYRIATTGKDAGDAWHAYNENKKRAEEILKRNEPLKKFLEEKQYEQMCFSGQSNA